MAAVIEQPAEQGCLPGSHEWDLPVRRVAAYFQSLGLPPASAARWAEEIVRDVPEDECGECRGRAMERAMSRVDDWLKAIATSCSDSSDDLAAQLKWHLRPVLQQHPESFLRTQDLPDDLHRAIREAAKPILPPSLPAVMPAQSFGDLPHLWQRVVAYGGQLRYRIANAVLRMWR